MLLGNDANRRAFAILFTKNYGQMMKEFINDDNDKSFSVTSLSVQIFTVPTLAHFLIAQFFSVVVGILVAVVVDVVIFVDAVGPN